MSEECKLHRGIRKSMEHISSGEAEFRHLIGIVKDILSVWIEPVVVPCHVIASVSGMELLKRSDHAAELIEGQHYLLR